MEPLTEGQQAVLRDELGRLGDYWQRLDARLHSALQLFAGIATLVVALASLEIRSSDGSSAPLTVGVVLVVLALLTALATVLLIGNQPGKLATIFAMERIRCVLVDQRDDLVLLPTFGRLHLRLEEISETGVLDEITRNDYRPLEIVMCVAVGLLLGTGTALVLGSAFDSVAMSVVAAFLGVPAGCFVTMFASGKAADRFALRLAPGLAG